MQPMAEAHPVRLRVLVVEDEVLIRIMIAEELRAAGLLVVEASSADEALSYIDAGEPLGLVFTDIRMPGSLNGLELARRLRDELPALPIILTSGDLDPRSAEGIGPFIRKPYDIDRTVAFIAGILDRGTREGFK